MRYDAVNFDRHRRFEGISCLHIIIRLHLTWKYYVPPKHYLCTKLHCVTRNSIFIVTAVGL